MLFQNRSYRRISNRPSTKKNPIVMFSLLINIRVFVWKLVCFVFKWWDMKYSNINLSLPCFTKISLTCSELSKTIFSKMSLLLEANFKIFSITISLGLTKSSIKFPTDKTEVICKESGSWSSLENIGLS